MNSGRPGSELSVEFRRDCSEKNKSRRSLPSRTTRRFRFGWLGTGYQGGLHGDLDLDRTSSPDRTILLAWLRRDSGGAGLGRTTSSVDDPAPLEGFGPRATVALDWARSVAHGRRSSFARVELERRRSWRGTRLSTLGRRSLIGQYSWGDGGGDESICNSAPDQKLLGSALFSFFLSFEICLRRHEARGGEGGTGVLNTFEGARSSLPEARLAYSSAGRAVCRPHARCRRDRKNVTSRGDILDHNVNRQPWCARRATFPIQLRRLPLRDLFS